MTRQSYWLHSARHGELVGALCYSSPTESYTYVGSAWGALVLGECAAQSAQLLDDEDEQVDVVYLLLLAC